MQQVEIQPMPNQQLSAVLGGQQVNLSIYTLPQMPAVDTNTIQSFIAVNQQFGTGDGRTTAFKINSDTTKILQRFAVTPAIYKTDWQGKQLQYPAARTNHAWPSNDYNHVNYVKTAGVTITPLYALAPDGSMAAQRVQMNAVNVDYITASFAGAANPHDQTVFIWLKSNTGANQYINLGDNTTGLNTEIVTPYWQRFSFSSNSPSSLYSFLLQAAQNGVDILAFEQNITDGLMAAGDIPTLTGSVTVTDYSMTAAGLVTFSSAPAFGSVLSWDGEFTYYNQLPSILQSSLFMDVSVNNSPICSCIPAFNLNKIVRGQGDFIGDFIFQDTQGNSDPTYDGLGSRYLLQYLEAADL